jgi:hypothetical protein
MIGSALIQIIKVNELRKGIGRESGKPYEMQDAECLLLNDDGSPSTVGVLQLPKDLQGDKAPKPGVYTGSFALKSNVMDRRIGAVLTSLVSAADRLRVKPSAAA